MFHSDGDFMQKLIFTLLISFAALDARAVDHGVLLRLSNRDGFVVMELENHSLSSVKVNRLFTQNPAFGLLNVKPKSLGGKAYVLRSSPNEDLPNNSSYIQLGPFDTIGHLFYVSDIKYFYKISESCFWLTIDYNDREASKFGALSSIIESNQIKVCSK